MGVEVRSSGGVVVIELEGSIDSQTAPAVQEKLVAALPSATRVLLEMSRVDFLSSAGLRLLLLAYRQTKARGGRVAIAGLKEEIKDVMETTGFLPYFTLAGTEEEGLAALRG